MFRQATLFLVLLTLSSALCAANTTVIINGKPVTLPVVDAAGKAYVDIVALMQMLGGKATYDAKAGKLHISTTAPVTGGGGAAATASSGTAQMAGDTGELGKVYSIRKENPLYFSLKSAEFSVSQLRIEDQFYYPKADEKLLILHFSVQNPMKTEQFVRWDSLKLTAVDAVNVNHESTNSDWGDEQSGQKIGITLKPAQKIEAFLALNVPAKGLIPKLIVMPPTENDGPVLRYDLRDKVKGLEPPFADPADPTTALDPVQGQLGTPYSMTNFDFTVEKTEYVTTKLDAEAPADEGRFLVATVLFKNKQVGNSYLRSDTISPTLTTEDGQELAYENMIGASGNQPIGQDVKPDAQVRVRIYFTVPKDVTPKKLSLKEEESRTYEFPVE